MRFVDLLCVTTPTTPQVAPLSPRITGRRDSIALRSQERSSGAMRSLGQPWSERPCKKPQPPNTIRYFIQPHHSPVFASAAAQDGERARARAGYSWSYAIAGRRCGEHRCAASCDWCTAPDECPPGSAPSYGRRTPNAAFECSVATPPSGRIQKWQRPRADAWGSTAAGQFWL